MKKGFLSITFAALLIPWARGNLPGLAATALSGDAGAVAGLRAAGPAGLEALFEAARPVVRELRQGTMRLDDPQAAPLRGAVDAVARQRDAYASGLYWFTDLEAAKAEAKKKGKPILSLRLLGNLDEEYCCANSRFFRTVLYANTQVSALLRECYVLHWKSVRPAPLLTIDMGDGRRIKRTITGNSIHYILNAEGRVLDALPGIYGPAGFIAALERAATHGTGATPEALRKWHGEEAHHLCVEWLGEAIKAGGYGEKARETLNGGGEEKEKLIRSLFAGAFPGSSLEAGSAAKEAGDRFGVPALNRGLRFGDDTISRNAIDALIREGTTHMNEIRGFPYPTEFDPPKGMVERPVMKQALPGGTANQALDPASVAAKPGSAATDNHLPLTDRMTQELWEKIARAYLRVSNLDESSRRFMLAKLPAEILQPEEIKTSWPANPNTPFGRTLGRFTEAITRDMMRNEYLNHNRIHQWLEEDKDGALSNNVEELNRKVYEAVFLTPDYDAWLGLVPEDTYTALEKDGCACDKGAPPMRAPRVAK